MLRMSTALCAALCVLALSAVEVNAAGKPSGTEFSEGWNTYATAAVGDWVEYQISEGNFRRIEVKAVSGDKITVTETLTLSGKANDPKEKKPTDWWMIKLPATLPTNMQVDWSTKEITHGGVKMNCAVASWMNGALSNEVYYCKDVKCGGYVKMVMGGKTSVFLKNYGDAGKKEGYLKGTVDPDAGKGPSLPPFYTSGGNVAVFKVTSPAGESFTRRESEGFDGKAATYSDTACDKDGKALADAKPVQVTISNEDWAKRYAKAAATGEKIKVTAGEYVCARFDSAEGTTTKKEWLTAEGVVAKSEFKDGDKTTTTELIAIRLR
ncbi:MAG: hypothetical protein KBG84_17350 [Planctomycetes bacterium]|nr:hypothetical protein [Planctomycetota bacterium]